MKKIVISTGGGDAPGLNAVIYAVVQSAHLRGWEVYGSRSGYKGLLDLDELVRLTPELIEDIPPAKTISPETTDVSDIKVKSMPSASWSVSSTKSPSSSVNFSL